MTRSDPFPRTVLARLRAPAAALAFLAAACGGAGDKPVETPSGPTLSAMTVAPSSPSVAKGLTQSFTATGHYSDGTAQDVTAAAAWSSSNPVVATVSNAAGSQGVATGVGIGSATITADFGGRRVAATLAVTPAALQSIAVTPDSASVAQGQSQGFTATGHYSDGTAADLTAAVAWTSSDPLVATVSGAAGSQGMATGMGIGAATIRAALDGRAGQASLVVTAAVLQSIAVAPAAASIAAGRTQPFTATGTWSDGSTADLTALALWTSTDPLVATVSSGVATGLAVGSATLQASFGGRTASATLQVTAAVLESVSVAPPVATVPAGLSQPFAATGHFSDGATADLTALAVWSTSDAAVATVSNAPGAQGVATGVGVGGATITAASGGRAGQATLSVTAPVLQSIQVTPATASVPKGLSQPFTAAAVYSDGSTADVTASAVWTAADGTVARLAGSVATGLAEGSTTVSAAWQGAAGSAGFTVTAPVPTALSLSPSNATIAAGTTLQYDAVALYSDGSKQDVSAAATWSSANGAAATVAPGGLVTAVAKGSTVVSAAWAGLTNSTALTVTDAVLTAISVEPSTAEVPLGVAQPFTATGIFTDGNRQDLTAVVAWASSAPGVATIAAGGVATPVAAGTTTITASASGVSGSAVLTVTGAVLQTLDVAPAAVSIALGTSVALRATATYSDGSVQDVTALATWASSDPAVTVSNAAGTQGVATGTAVGAATVTAAFGGLTAPAAVTVTAAVLQQVVVDPPSDTVPAGLTRQLTATGHYSDGSTQNLTATVLWSSSDEAVAAVSNSAGSEGLVTAIQAGTAVISAATGGLTGSATITVTGVALQSIAVSPSGATLPSGYTLQLQAVGTYADGSTKNLTTQATWTSSNTAVATVSNAAGSQGLVTGLTVSSPTAVTISAQLAGVTGSAPLTVSNTRISSVAVAPSPFTVAVGGAVQLAAQATFQDGTLLDITRQCTWTSSSKSTASVSKTGLVSGLKPGAVTITASKQSKRGTASGTVQ